MAISIDTAVTRIINARLATAPLTLLSAQGEFSLSHAYDIQDALRAEMIRRHQVPVGWKLAATGPAGQELFGIKEPIFGFLTPRTYASGAHVSAREFVSLHVEAEIAFKLGTELAGPGVTAVDAFAAVESVMPAIEVPDILFATIPPVSDAIANSALAGAIVLGSEMMLSDPRDLAGEEVAFVHNGEVVSTNTGRELMGDPLNALAWLANQLAVRGHSLARGDIVMSGGISKLLRPEVGDRIEASFTGLGLVSMTIVA
ncbi:MAG: 2-keto-4-pentenoate hydratase [Gammaproteobacteria bacterium]